MIVILDGVIVDARSLESIVLIVLSKNERFVVLR